MTAFTILVVVASVAAGLIGGVFFAFSVFVMRALAGQPTAQGVAAMQRINVTVMNPLFLGTFLGALPLLAAAALVARAAGDPRGLAWLAAAFIVYASGSIGVTMAFNVPRNDKLAGLPPGSAEAAAYWPIYVREWMLWNHVRCMASLAAAACAACALAG